MDKLNINRARPEDAPAISALILSVADPFFLTPERLGAEKFLEHLAPESIAGCINGPEFAYYAAWLDGALAGVVAVRNASHLYHLFVSPQLQNQGLGSMLWEHVLMHDLAEAERITVNASQNALGFYEGLGFQASAERTEMNGVAFYPMVFQ